MWRRVFSRSILSRGVTAAFDAGCRVGVISPGFRPVYVAREFPTFKDNVFSSLKRRGYQRHNRREWSNFFARFTTFISPALLLASPIYHEETDIDESQAIGTKDDDILKLLEKGRGMIDTKCSMESIEKVYIDALHLALTRTDKSTIAYVQDILANFYLRHGQLKKAEEMFRKVIRNLLDSGTKENHASVIEISLKLATIYASSKNAELATTGYEWVIEKCRENIEKLGGSQKTKNFDSEFRNHTALLGMTLDSYGRYLYVNGKYTRSLEVSKEAYELSKQLFGEGDVRTLVIQNDIGAILSAIGDLDEAERVIEKAIAVASSRKDIDHGDVAVFWVNLSSIYKRHKKLEKMAEAFQNARKEAKLAKNHSLLKQVERNIQFVEEI